MELELENNQTKKSSFYASRLFYLICGLTGVPGLLILVWCGWVKGNPFPYAALIGLALVISCTLVTVIADKTAWVKGRNNYPDDLGGPPCG